jgi:hypothetical protein
MLSFRQRTTPALFYLKKDFGVYQNATNKVTRQIKRKVQKFRNGELKIGAKIAEVSCPR